MARTSTPAAGAAEALDFQRLAAFLAGLAAHNERPWFDANRAEYQALREGFIGVVADLIARISTWDERVQWVNPRECIFRIHRDTRFSRSKAPYKTHMAAVIGEDGHKHGRPGYYFHVDAKGALVVATGIHMPDANELGRIRACIAEHPERMDAVLAAPGFAETFGEIQGERLKRPPRGFGPETPHLELVKLKSFYLMRDRPVREASAGEVVPWMADSFHAMYPFLAWARDAVEYEPRAS